MKYFYYIAYGSNLNIAQMKFRCPCARVVGNSMLKGYSLRFRGSKTGSYLTVEKDAEGCVPVGVWAVSAKDLQSLDRYEGYPTFYRKEEIPIKIGEKTANAVIYIINEGRPYGPPSSLYMNTCLQGYYDFGFNTDYLYEAVNKSKGEKNNDR